MGYTTPSGQRGQPENSVLPHHGFPWEQEAYFRVGVGMSVGRNLPAKVQAQESNSRMCDTTYMDVTHSSCRLFHIKHKKEPVLFHVRPRNILPNPPDAS